MDKSWYLSRGVWIGILTASIGSMEVVRDAVINGDFSTLGIVTMVLGILKVWERLTR